MVLRKLLRLWSFIILIWPCFTSGTPNKPYFRQPYGKAAQAHLGRDYFTRFGGTKTRLRCANMCSIVTQKYPAYQCQDYEVQTKDGYILSLVNIPAGRDGINTSSKQPVVLQHGVLADGMTWLLNPPDQSLGFILADAGFDVWIVNTRGTRFSQRHVTLEPTMPDFWNWSWDELSKYDLPAALGFVFNKTQQKMHYVGHSMGTTTVMAALAERRELDKLKSAALLSPVAYLTHMTTSLGKYACESFVGELNILFGLRKFDVKAQPVATFMQLLCDLPSVNCFDFMDSIAGPNCCLNNSEIGYVLQHFPQPTSTKTLVHFAQSYRDGKFRKYDYGSSLINTEQYGQPEPPVYDLTNIPKDFPLYISYGGLDALSDPDDVNTLRGLLKGHDQNKLTIQCVQQYAHLDFIMGTTAKDVVYNKLVDYFREQA